MGIHALPVAGSYSSVITKILTDAGRLAEKLGNSSLLSGNTGNIEKFWKYRAYQGGESVSIIDWRLSARTETLFVREREKNISQTYYFWADLSILRNAESRMLDKIVIMFTLIRKLLGNGEKVAWLDKQKITASSSDGFHSFINKVFISLNDGEDMPKLLPLKNRSKVVLCGNFSDNSDKWNDRLRKYSNQGVRGVVFHIGDVVPSSYLQSLVKNTGWHYMAHNDKKTSVSELLRLTNTLAALNVS